MAGFDDGRIGWRWGGNGVSETFSVFLRKNLKRYMEGETHDPEEYHRCTARLISETHEAILSGDAEAKAFFKEWQDFGRAHNLLIEQQVHEAQRELWTYSKVQVLRISPDGRKYLSELWERPHRPGVYAFSRTWEDKYVRQMDYRFPKQMWVQPTHDHPTKGSFVEAEMPCRIDGDLIVMKPVVCFPHATLLSRMVTEL